MEEQEQRKIEKPRRLAWFNPTGKSRGVRFRLGCLTGFVLLIAGICLGLMNLWFGTGRYGRELFNFYFTQPGLVLWNVLPFVLLIFLLWALTNRAWVAFLATGSFTLIYSWAEYWKLLARSDPIVAEDLTVISEGVTMGARYIEVTGSIILSAVLVLLATLLFFFFFRGRLPRLPFRLGLAALLIAAAGLLYGNVYLDNERYESYACWESLNVWIDSNQFISRGCMYPFLNSIQKAVPSPPRAYSEAAAVYLLEEYETDPIPQDRKVNVIVIMGEAFTDFSQYTDMITGVDPYADYHAVRDQSIHGTLVSNVFAGGTFNTERCALTGFPFLTDFRRASWSYARYFADQGYALNGSHPGYESFYNRNNVNANLGIEQYYFYENHYDEICDDRITPDAILFPEILRLCREDLKQKDYVFSFNVTYQNHGPYATDTVYFSEVYVPPQGLDGETYTIVNNYLSGIADTGAQLRALTDELNADDTPWVLVFFGDHKPWLGDQNIGYEALGIDMTDGSIESIHNYRDTEYLIWANGAAKAKLGTDFCGEGPAISPCYLMNRLFDACGWEGPSFLKFSRQTEQLLPVICLGDYYIVDDRFLYFDALPNVLQNAAMRMHYVSYFLTQNGGVLPAAKTK